MMPKEFDEEEAFLQQKELTDEQIAVLVDEQNIQEQISEYEEMTEAQAERLAADAELLDAEAEALVANYELPEHV